MELPIMASGVRWRYSSKKFARWSSVSRPLPVGPAGPQEFYEPARVIAPLDIGIRQVPPVRRPAGYLTHITHVIGIGTPGFNRDPTDEHNRHQRTRTTRAAPRQHFVQQHASQDKEKWKSGKVITHADVDVAEQNEERIECERP